LFDKVLGLPAHPLFIHGAVVLVPLLALTAILYAVWAGSRRHIRWPMIVLAVATPGAVFAAKESGESFSRSANFQAGEIQAKIEQHEGFGNTLFLVILGLAVVTLVMAFMVAVTLDATPRIKVPVAAHWVVIALAVILGAAALYYIFRAGDSGAHMVWSGF
jgi:hypothetical protein